MKSILIYSTLLFSAAYSCGSFAATTDLLADALSQLKPNFTSEFYTFATAYYPANTPMQGGMKDRKGNPLHTLQEFLSGQAPFVSVAMDVHAFPYGTRISIPRISRHYGVEIVFAVVDTGGAFRGRGTSRIDICTQNRAASMAPEVNGPMAFVIP